MLTKYLVSLRALSISDICDDGWGIVGVYMGIARKKL